MGRKKGSKNKPTTTKEKITSSEDHPISSSSYMLSDDTSIAETKESTEIENKQEVVDSLLEVMQESTKKEISKKDWLEFVNSLEDTDYGEFYVILNETLNSGLDTTRFQMSTKRTNLLGKLTKSTLKLILPVIKPYYLLILALVVCYVPAAVLTAMDKYKAKKEKEKEQVGGKK